MFKFQHIQSYELLTAILSIDKESFTSVKKSLKQFSELLDIHFSTSDFISIYERLSSTSFNQYNNIEEELFLDIHKLTLNYTNLEILSKKERFILYTCVKGWLEKLKISLLDTGILSRILSIENEYDEIVTYFFQTDIQYPVSKGNYELFILRSFSELKDNLEGTWIESNIPKNISNEGYFTFEGLIHSYKVLYVRDLKLFFIVCNEPGRQINKRGIDSVCDWELIEPGDVIQIEETVSLDYSELKRYYLKDKFGEKLILEVADLSYAYSLGKGVNTFGMQIENGTLVGIMGKEGTGKSTILKLLAGELISKHGEVRINGYSLRKDLYYLKGMIGFVPEEDLLYDELTVLENLYYTARLYLGKLDEVTLSSKVEHLLKLLDLAGIKNKVVGRVRGKNLQPEQRRLLNIALELIREPQILVVDNALSPLSVADTPKILEILSDYSFHGHIVITSITQTDNKSIRLFDNILIIDEGGYPVFYGKLNDAWKNFLTLYRSENIEMSAIEPASIIQFISQPTYSIKGEPYERYKSPIELYYNYRRQYATDSKKIVERNVLPENILSTPSLDRQYLIFNLLNFKTKIARTRELIYTILLSPLLALVFSFFMRSGTNQGYSFSDNTYIPTFYFTSFLLSVFMGLILSVNEIYREKNIIHKEAYLNISYFSYINSKITYLFIINLVQSFLFTLISNAILQIKGMMAMHWLIFFSCQSFGMLLGLILSGTHKIIENFYLRSMPLILIFQLLFGGGFITFDSYPGNKINTPLLSDFMVTRWAYEAMLVYQFRENDYMKPLYEFNRDIAAGTMYSYHIIPLLCNRIKYCIQDHASVKDSMDSYCESIRNELLRIAKHFDVFPYENINRITPEDFNPELAEDLNDYLEYIDMYFYSLFDQTIIEKEEFLKNLSDSLGKNYLLCLKKGHMNNSVELEVTKSEEQQKIKIVSNELVVISDPIYQYPFSNNGRTRFFVPEKKINGQLIDTVEFDISIIWLMNLFLYILLVFDVFNLTRTRMKISVS